MQMRLVAILASVAWIAASSAFASTPGESADACQSPQDVITIELRNVGRIAIADLQPDISANLANNLKHFEAADVTGAHLIIIRRLGSPLARIDAYRAGCRVRSIWIDTGYLNVLLRVRL